MQHYKRVLANLLLGNLLQKNIRKQDACSIILFCNLRRWTWSASRQNKLKQPFSSPQKTLIRSQDDDP